MLAETFANSCLPAPIYCPTRVVAAIDIPIAGMKETDRIWSAMWFAASCSIPNLEIIIVKTKKAKMSMKNWIPIGIPIRSIRLIW